MKKGNDRTKVNMDYLLKVGMVMFFVAYLRLGLLDTHLGLILVNSTLSIPFSVWLLKGFFDTIPVELEEAAAIGGCGRMRTLGKEPRVVS